MTGTFAANLNQQHFYDELQSWESVIGKGRTVTVISHLAKFIFHLKDFRSFISKSEEWTTIMSQELAKQLNSIKFKRDDQVKEEVWLNILKTLKKEGRRGPIAPFTEKKTRDFTEDDKETIRQVYRDDPKVSQLKLAKDWGTTRQVIRTIINQ